MPTENRTVQFHFQHLINKMLKTSPEFIMHYSIEDNAEEIWNEYMGIPIEM